MARRGRGVSQAASGFAPWRCPAAARWRTSPASRHRLPSLPRTARPHRRRRTNPLPLRRPSQPQVPPASKLRAVSPRHPRQAILRPPSAGHRSWRNSAARRQNRQRAHSPRLDRPSLRPAARRCRMARPHKTPPRPPSRPWLAPMRLAARRHRPWGERCRRRARPGRPRPLLDRGGRSRRCAASGGRRRAGGRRGPADRRGAGAPAPDHRRTARRRAGSRARPRTIGRRSQTGSAHRHTSRAAARLPRRAPAQRQR